MRSQLVLVTYGSSRGGTAEIGHWVGDTLRDAGLRVEVRSAGEVRNVDAYDVVILGGALYAGRWHKDARRFVRRHARALRARRVWLFASGPLDRSAEQDGHTPVPAPLVRAASGRPDRVPVDDVIVASFVSCDQVAGFCQGLVDAAASQVAAGDADEAVAGTGGPGPKS